MMSRGFFGMHIPFVLRQIALISLCAGASATHAGLFDDEEARKAILDLRQRVDAVRSSADDNHRRLAEDSKRASDDAAQFRGALLDLQNQIEALKQDVSKLRGQNEQLARDLSDAQRRQKDLASGVDDRLRRFEPVKVALDGKEFAAEPVEKRDYDAAFAVFRKGDFGPAQTAFSDFLKRYPQSGYVSSAFFWLANAQYANREFKEALANFRAFASQFADHPRAPEALLSAANCQVELKDNRGARKTLDDLVKAYPQSEAATAARERASKLK